MSVDKESINATTDETWNGYVLNAFGKAFKRHFDECQKLASDPEYQKQQAEELKKWEAAVLELELKLKGVVKEGDLIVEHSCHSLEPHTYEVSRIDSRGPVSQPACFLHRWVDIIAVYRLTKSGKNYKCIWRKSDSETET